MIEFNHDEDKGRTIFDAEFTPPTPEFEAPWGAGERPLTHDEHVLYGDREITEADVVGSFLQDAVGHTDTYDVDAFIADTLGD